MARQVLAKHRTKLEANASFIIIRFVYILFSHVSFSIFCGSSHWVLEERSQKFRIYVLVHISTELAFIFFLWYI